MTTEHDADNALLAGIRNHDEDALKQLIRKYHDRLCRFSISMLRRRELAEEAVDNVFLTFWRRRETVKIATNVRSYLYGAVGYQSINLLAGEAKTKLVRIDDVPSHKLVDARSADSDLLYQELQNEVDRLLAAMPPQRQLIFRMHRIEAMRYKEIAAALGISERTVQNHMLQAIEQLSEALAPFRRLLGGHNRTG